MLTGWSKEDLSSAVDLPPMSLSWKTFHLSRSDCSANENSSLSSGRTKGFWTAENQQIYHLKMMSDIHLQSECLQLAVHSSWTVRSASTSVKIICNIP